MAGLSEDNLDKTTYEPVYYVVNSPCLSDPSVLEEILSGLADGAENDFLVVPLSAVTAGGAGKKKDAKKPAKGKEEEEPDEADQSIPDGTGTAIKEFVEKQASSRQDALYAKRKAALAELDGGAKGGKGAKATPAKGAKAPKGAKPAAAEAGDGDGTTRPAIKYPATLPLHVILDGIVNSERDAEKLHDDGVTIHCVVNIKDHSDRVQMEAKDEEEFTYGAPLSPMQAKRTLDAKKPADAKPAAEKNAAEANATKTTEERKETFDLSVLRDSNHSFRDLGVLTLYTPDPALLSGPVAEEEDEEDAGKKGGKGAKGGKKGKEDTKLDEGSQKLVAIVQKELELSTRMFSTQKSQFEHWRAGGTTKDLPSAVPAAEVDLRLYGNLLSRVPGPSSISLLLHAMFEQVAATSKEEDLAPMFTEQKSSELESFLDKTFAEMIGQDLLQDEGAVDNAAPSAVDAVLGGPCVYKDGVCLACGGSEYSGNITSQDEESAIFQSAPPTAAVLESTVETVMAVAMPVDADEPQEGVESCPGQNGAPHQFVDGTCSECGTVDPSSTGIPVDLASNEGELCQATMGERHQYVGGRCINCGAAGNPPIVDVEVVPEGTLSALPVLLGAGDTDIISVTDVAFIDGDGDAAGGADYEEVCPMTLGLPHELEDGRCTRCGSFVDEPGAANWNADEASLCPGTMGNPHEYENGICTQCGEAQPGNEDGVSRPMSTQSGRSTAASFREVHSPCPATIGKPHNPKNGVCVNCGNRVELQVATERFCPATLGGEHEWDDNRNCSMCGFEQPAGGLREGKICPATISGGKRLQTIPSTVVLKHGDKRRIMQAQVCAATGTSLEDLPFADDDAAMSTYLPVPGRDRLGFPAAASKSMAERGIERTELLNASELPADTFERGLLSLSFEEMLEIPGPSFAFTREKHLQFFHVEHLYRDNPMIDATVKHRLQLLRDAAKKRGSMHEKNPLIEKIRFNEKIGIGEEDETVEQARQPWKWDLGRREYREEYSPDVLCQVLTDAILDYSDTTHIQARYEPLDDTLLVCVHARTPLERHRTVRWEDFVCPNFAFKDWAASTAAVQERKPEVLFNFPNGHKGTLTHTAQVMYPRDGGRLASVVTQSGAKKFASACLLKDKTLIYLQRAVTKDLDGATFPPNPESNVLTSYFHDRSILAVHKGSMDDGSEADGESVNVVYTTVSGLSVTITASGTVYMSYPKWQAKQTTPAVGGLSADSQPQGAAQGTASADGAVDPAANATPEEDGQTATGDAATQPGLPTTAEGAEVEVAKETGFEIGMRGELWRCIRENGTVLKKMQDGSLQCLLPDGNISIKKEGSSDWITTNNQGIQTSRAEDGSVKQVGQINVATQIDMETGSKVVTREDLAMCISYKDGNKLAQHSDATRIYMDSSKDANKYSYVVECPDFVPVTFDIEKLTKLDNSSRDKGNLIEVTNTTTRVDLDDGTIITKVNPKGMVEILRRDGSKFICCGGGKVIFIPKTVDPETIPEALLNGDYDERSLPPECYRWDYMEGSVFVQDLEENQYSADLKGAYKCLLSRNESLDASAQMAAKYYPPPENPIQPRVFVVRGDGTGYELLHPGAVEEYLAEVAKNPFIKAIHPQRLRGAEEGGESVQEVSMKFLETLPPPTSYQRAPVIPNVLKAAPQGLLPERKATTNYVVYRHLIRTTPISAEQQEVVAADKTRFYEWKANQVKQELDFEVEDDRTPEEIEEEERLQQEVSLARARRKEQEISSLLERHSQVAARSASVRSEEDSRAMGLGDNGPLYEARKKQPVTTVPLSTAGPDGESVPVKFFPPKGEPVPSKPPRSRQPSTLAAARRQSSVEPLFGGFFRNPTFKQKYGMGTMLEELDKMCHPLYQPGMTASDLENVLADHSHEQQAIAHEQHERQVAAAVEGLRQVILLVNRVFKRPHDPTLRTIDLSQPPYSSIINAEEGSEVLVAVTVPLLNCLGFEARQGEGTLVQMQSDLFLKDGVRELIALLKEFKANSTRRSGKEVVEDEDPVQMPGDGYDSDDSIEGPELTYEDMVRDMEAQKEAAKKETRRYMRYLQREQRLMIASQELPVHERQGISFKQRNEFLPDKDLEFTQHARTYQHTQNPLAFTLTGKRRTQGVNLPESLQPSAQGELNYKYIRQEMDAQRSVKISSTVRRTHSEPTNKFADFTLHPATVEFGQLTKGCTYRMTVALTNVGYNVGNFQVVKPVPAAGSRNVLSVMYRPGEVAPGIKKRVEVQLYAGDLGEFNDIIVIRTEKLNFNLPVSAVIAAGSGPKSVKPITKRPPHNVPPLDTTSRFGQTGAVRFFSDEPSPTTQSYLAKIGRPPSANPMNGGSRPASGRSRSSRPGSSRRASAISQQLGVREPTVPSMEETEYPVDPNVSLQELLARNEGGAPPTDERI